MADARFELLLLTNGPQSRRQASPDPLPAVRLCAPDVRATWLPGEIDREDRDIALGLRDLELDFQGMGSRPPMSWPTCAACRGCRSCASALPHA
ncbi:hypothetical protein J2W27_004642 [Variovorax boronicumulans]|uniref:DUF2958 domain-containing protein n=1 Tax=Variovorax boronicumulans TaxID=436515 RepID=UPI00278A989B|nr:DUF2958 domain-containing protein [Variovorax boronicumulans]MDP9912516.1 hypothetical protein [Variovorax boronicumulans]